MSSPSTESCIVKKRKYRRDKNTTLKQKQAIKTTRRDIAVRSWNSSCLMTFYAYKCTRKNNDISCTKNQCISNLFCSTISPSSTPDTSSMPTCWTEHILPIPSTAVHCICYVDQITTSDRTDATTFKRYGGFGTRTPTKY
ncbi:hypothetical protein Tco_1052646 [Tanacetum coccineum]